MNLPSNIIVSQFCNQHQQPIKFYDTSKNQACCEICLQERDLVSMDIYQQQMKEFIDKEKYNYNNIQLFQQIYDEFIKCKNKIIMSFEKILQTIQEQINSIESHYQKFQQLIQQKNISINDLQMKSYKQSQQIKQIKNKLKQLIEELKMRYFNSEQLIVQIDQKPKQFIEQKKIKFELHYTYQWLLPEAENFRVFSFNKRSSILLVAKQRYIIVNQFHNGKIIKELQILGDHTDNVFCVQFMKNQNSFVSGSFDGWIIIWELDEVGNKWVAQWKLKDHKNIIDCILINKEENQLISGSYDKTIKFWNKINNSWECDQTIATEIFVYAISMNESENKLIACGCNTLIVIMEKAFDNKWIIIQKINVDVGGARLCFSTQSQFVFQPREGDQLEVYGYDEVNKQFNKIKNIKTQNQKDEYLFFPCQYIKDLKIITVKHGQYLNIIKINQEGEYELIQSIDFTHFRLYGTMTEDGQYLVTWDRGSQQIQIRHLIEEN